MQLRANTPDGLAALGQILSKYPKANATATIPSSQELLLDVLKTTLWPVAVPETMIVKDEPTKKIRASSIVSTFIKQPIADKRVLDFGCGEGYTTAEIQRSGAAVSVGYDIASNDAWTKFPGVKFTTNLQEVAANGPYDIILLYDVMDHLVGTTPVEFLKQIATMMSASTRLYIRFHPITSPHGTHLYQTLNKAYAHLLFDQEVLASLGGVSEPTIQTYPQANLKDAGLQVVGQITRHTIAPDQFFTDDFITSTIIARNFKEKPVTKEQLLQIMAVHFVDAIVTRPDAPVLQQT
jgi:2-polyprenyl-3-methyl-5-hydroxy-6-metoxy-1,4-benzoquinol methylase